MDIKQTSVNGILTCTLGDISSIAFHTPFSIKNSYFLKKKLGFIKREKIIFSIPLRLILD